MLNDSEGSLVLLHVQLEIGSLRLKPVKSNAQEGVEFGIIIVVSEDDGQIHTLEVRM